MKWYAIYTKPKAEDSVTKLLENAGIPVINPKISIRKYRRKKYADVIEPLFPCYMFARFDADTHTHMITYTRGVRYIVGKEHPVEVPETMISAVLEQMKDGIIHPPEEELQSGDRVLIMEGPFRDFYGVFDGKMSGKERAMVFLETLNYKLDIEKRSIKKV